MDRACQSFLDQQVEESLGWLAIHGFCELSRVQAIRERENGSSCHRFDSREVQSLKAGQCHHRIFEQGGGGSPLISPYFERNLMKVWVSTERPLGLIGHKRELASRGNYGFRRLRSNCSRVPNWTDPTFQLPGYEHVGVVVDVMSHMAYEAFSQIQDQIMISQIGDSPHVPSTHLFLPTPVVFVTQMLDSRASHLHLAALETQHLVPVQLLQTHGDKRQPPRHIPNEIYRPQSNRDRYAESLRHQTSRGCVSGRWPVPAVPRLNCRQDLVPPPPRAHHGRSLSSPRLSGGTIRVHPRGAAQSKKIRPR